MNIKQTLTDSYKIDLAVRIWIAKNAKGYYLDYGNLYDPSDEKVNLRYTFSEKLNSLVVFETNIVIPQNDILEIIQATF